MKKFASISLVALIIISSCKKSSEENPIPSKYANNEVNATVSISGAPAFTITGKTSPWAQFVRNINRNGDTIIYISVLSSSKGQVNITLVNINLPGSYVFEKLQNVRQYSFCDYSIGGQLGSNGLFYLMPPGIPSGTVTIEELTPTFIKGTFSATCYEPNGTNGVAQITNGSFKGVFY